LVLAKHAGSIGHGDSLASWLYGVALRVSASARAAAARRRRHERNWAALRRAHVSVEEKRRENLEPFLHAEIGRLSERFRALIILCYLEGRMDEGAARLLHCPVGTVKSRLAMARKRLRDGLGPLELPSLSALVSGEHGIGPATSAVSTRLADATVQAVVQGAARGAVPALVSILAEGVLNTMILNRLNPAAAVLVNLAALATGASALAWPTDGRSPPVNATADSTFHANARGRASRSQALVRDGIPTSLSGRVFDEQDRLIPGAEVRVKLFRRSFSALMEDSELVALWQARADANSRYQIDGFRWVHGPGSVYLQADVNASDFVELFTFSFWEPAQAGLAKGIFPDVQLKQGNSVTGRCIDPDGNSVAGAKIQKIFAGFARSSLGNMPTTDD
jgi:Sigma-70, region 4